MRHLDQIRHTLRQSFYGFLKLTQWHSNANRHVFPFHESKSDPLDPINEFVVAVIRNHRPLIILLPFTSRSRRAASFTRAASNESYSQRGPPTSGRIIWSTTATRKVIQFKVVSRSRTTFANFGFFFFYAAMSKRGNILICLLTDESIPTVVLDGISNTETGHCAKSMALMADMWRRIDDPDKRLDWLVIADDDTLLSVQRLERLLSCYDPSRPVLLGQRYGYANNHRHGYDYVTGKSMERPSRRVPHSRLGADSN